MKYMLLMNYTPDVPPISEWQPEDVKASGAAMGAIHEELTARGELVGAEGLTGPEAAKSLVEGNLDREDPDVGRQEIRRGGHGSNRLDVAAQRLVNEGDDAHDDRLYVSLRDKRQPTLARMRPLPGQT